MKRRYIDGRWGQVHAIEGGRPDTNRPSLICLHATAYSSTTMVPLIAALVEEGRHVIALDTPGYGASDAPPAMVRIEDYGAALADAIEALALPRPVDLFGYHTGVTIAVEAALSSPARVRRIAMMGVPLFDGPDRPLWKLQLANRHTLGETLDQFEERWTYLVTGRPQGLSLARGFGNFVDELRAWPNGWWAHEALFAHDLAARLPALRQPVLVLNPSSPLAAMSARAAALIADATLIDLPHLSGAVLECAAPEIAGLIGGFLDRPLASRHAISASTQS